MKKNEVLGQKLTREQQMGIVGGFEGTCTVSFSCPAGCGGGSVSCSSNSGNCHRDVTTGCVQCDSDPKQCCCTSS